MPALLIVVLEYKHLKLLAVASTVALQCSKNKASYEEPLWRYQDSERGAINIMQC